MTRDPSFSPQTPGDARAAWVRGRARNTLRHPALIAVVGGLAFVAALVTLVVVPRAVQREAQSVAPRPGERPDTIPLAARLARAEAAVATADSAFNAARDRALNPPPPTPVVMAVPPDVAARRDSLAGRVAAIDSLLARIEKAPLLGSYRALGEAPELRVQSGVKTMLDSLANIESEREAFGAIGGVDPMFVTLTARANEVGRTIEAIGRGVRDQMRRQIAALAPPAPPPPVAVVVDTVTPRVRAEYARLTLRAADSTLVDARRVNRELDAREARARELANVGAPPLARLAASLVFGLFVGFAVALFREVRRPRIADPGEAERVAGVRVLGVVAPTPPIPDRQRRQADREVPPLLDLNAPSYRYAYLHLASASSRLIMVTLVGDDAAVVATTAANIAAVSAQEARTTLVVDAAEGALGGVLRTRASPGLAEILGGKVGWPDATTHAMIGRDRALDVVPTGTSTNAPSLPDVADRLGHDLARLSRRYETIVIVAPLEYIQAGLGARLPIADVIYCARVGRTTLAALRAGVEGLRLGGAEVRGVVLWDMEEPRIVPGVEEPVREAEGVAVEG